MKRPRARKTLGLLAQRTSWNSTFFRALHNEKMNDDLLFTVATFDALSNTLTDSSSRITGFAFRMASALTY